MKNKWTTQTEQGLHGEVGDPQVSRAAWGSGGIPKCPGLHGKVGDPSSLRSAWGLEEGGTSKEGRTSFLQRLLDLESICAHHIHI